ncbi:MAG: helix-turn-helix domain-containing protein [Clostridia bacterium]|nr:helix-turn-helix domain-containing protein [Clostridia bacterium]
MQRIDGKYLQELRKEHGYSLRAFAEKIYVSKTTVSRWESSVLPEDENTLARIAEVFGTTVEDMRTQSALKYNDGKPIPAPKKEEDEEDLLSAEQRAEARFGIRGLAICLGIGLVAVLVLMVFLLL